jgi:hypothetical protein
MTGPERKGKRGPPNDSEPGSDEGDEGELLEGIEDDVGEEGEDGGDGDESPPKEGRSVRRRGNAQPR